MHEIQTEPAYMRVRKARCVHCKKHFRVDVQKKKLREVASPCCDQAMRTERWRGWDLRVPLHRVELANRESDVSAMS